VSKSKETVANTSTGVAELERRVETAIDVIKKSLEQISAGTADPKWFPHGITKICVKLHIGEFQFEVEVSGPTGKSNSNSNSNSDNS
jgi:hypothetical protein